MTESLDALAGWLAGLPPAGIIATVFAIAYLENVIPPLPGDALVVVAGSVAALEVVGVVPVYVAAVVGSTLGFLTMLAVGRYFGEAIYDPNRLRWIPQGPLHSVEAWFARWGMGVIAANRFLSGGRAVIALLAGASRLPLAPVVILATASALAWSAILVGGGYWLGSEYDRLLAYLGQYGRAVSVGLAAGAVGYVAWRVAQSRRRSDGQDEERNREDPSGGAPETPGS